MCARLKLTPRLDMKIATEASLGQLAPVAVAPRTRPELMRWGWTLPTGAKLYWARSEGIFQGPFSYQAMHQRGVVQIDGWWEREAYIRTPRPTFVAVIWHEWTKGDPGFLLITCNPWSDKLARIHDRMPAIVSRDVWLARLRRDQTLAVPTRNQTCVVQ
jgi:putative SOS response-associated peptidase YedK